MKTENGKVYLVGAGPGDPGLITVRGAELLSKADCVIYDKLANSVLLSFVPKNTEIIAVPKRVNANSVTQEDINLLMVDRAASGKVVVRLKGGDPCIFGRGAEEAQFLIEAGIDFEIVPGVTAAIAAAEYAGIMLTHREYSSQVVFVTGHEAPGKAQSSVDWKLLAKFRGTIVFYMGIINLEAIASELIKNGMDQFTACAIISDATLPSQSLVKDSLQRIAQTSKRVGVAPPALVIIGSAAAQGDELNWFGRKKLLGKNIVLTRDADGNAELAKEVMRLAANPICFNSIKIKPLTSSKAFLETISKLSQYDWIIFTSANGVKFFFSFLADLKKDARIFANARIAAIGSKTAVELKEKGIAADIVPQNFTSQALGLELLNKYNLRGKKILLLRSELATGELADILTNAAAEVTTAAVYTCVAQSEDRSDLIDLLREGSIDWVTFASPFCAKVFFEQVPYDLIISSGCKIASIGPVTSRQLVELGLQVTVESKEHTFEGLLDTIEEYKVT